MLDRQQQVADIEAQRAAAGGGTSSWTDSGVGEGEDDVDDNFILDPSVLTVQDLQVLLYHHHHLALMDGWVYIYTGSWD
jgi:hypothetical protein